MKQSKRTSVMIKCGFFAVFFLFIAFIILLLMFLLVPAKEVPSDSAGTSGVSDVKNSFGSTDPMPSDTDPSEGGRKSYQYDFISDLSNYEGYMNPEGDDYLFLVNKDHKLQENYVPEDLIEVINTRKDGRNTQKMREYAAKSLEAFFIEAEAAGMTYVNSATGQSLSVMSAYRSYSYPQTLFRNKVNQYASYGDQAEEMAAKIVQYPGASEHQSGLCCDMHNLSEADTSFSAQQAAVWLAENCYKFGFILRYPADKTEITGISYEPWHFRYVGRYHATKMHELNMCLEEYMEYIGK